MRDMPPSPTPPTPSVAPAPDQTIVVTVLPSTPTQTSAPSANQTTVDVTIPQQIWDRLTAGTAGGAHCRSQGVGELLCENGETFSHVASAVSSLVTVLAVIIGGVWAYRKFVQGRTFQPRSSIEVSAQWHVLAGVDHVLQVRICVTNIGGSKLTLLQRETGVRILFPADKQTPATRRSEDPWWADIRWEPVPKREGQEEPRTFVILRNHVFIEPGENVFDDMLLNLGRDPTIVQVQAQLCWEVPRWWWKNGEVYDFVDQIIPPGTVIYENQRTGDAHGALKEVS